ncbi:MAG TPA: flagellar hook-length control protein FliK [Rhizomicrobium sp.]
MTAVAASIVTTGSGTNSVSGPTASTGDDGFAAILGGVLQAPANDKAVVAASAVQGDEQADIATDASSDPAADTRSLQSLQSLQEVTQPGDQACRPAASQDASTDPGSIPVSLPQDPGMQNGGAATATNPNPATGNSPRLTKSVASDPARVAAGEIAKPANDPNDDPLLAQMLAAQQPLPAAIVAATTTDTSSSTQAPAGVQADPAQLAAGALAAPSSTVTAAAILSGGAITKPAKPGTADATGDSEKTQSQGSTAAALADSAVSRLFTDQQVSSAHALPLHSAADPAKSDNQSGGSQPEQHNPASTAAPAQASAPDAPAANTNFAPALAHAAPQQNVSPAVNTAAAPAAPIASVGAGAPAQAAAQLQVAHPATPDINSLAFNIATRSEGGARHFDIRLDPAELGRVDVRLTVDDAGKAQATLSVEKPQTLALLQKDQGHLERALKDAGLDLSQNGLNFSLKGQQQQAGHGSDTPSPRGRALAVRAIAAVETAASNLSLSSVSASDTRLDIRV